MQTHPVRDEVVLEFGLRCSRDQYGHHATVGGTGAHHKAARKSGVIALMVRGYSVLLSTGMRMLQYDVTKIRLQETCIDMPHLIETSGNVQTKSKRGCELFAAVDLFARKPARGSEGKLHLVTIAIFNRRGQR